MKKNVDKRLSVLSPLKRIRRCWSSFNPLIPEFLKLILPFLNLDLSIDVKRDFSLKQKTGPKGSKLEVLVS